jgi:hypothetical protein
MDFMQARIEIIEQPLRVNRSAGPRHGNKNFQPLHHATSAPLPQARRFFLLILILISIAKEIGD